MWLDTRQARYYSMTGCKLTVFTLLTWTVMQFLSSLNGTQRNLDLQRNFNGSQRQNECRYCILNKGGICLDCPCISVINSLHRSQSTTLNSLTWSSRYMITHIMRKERRENEVGKGQHAWDHKLITINLNIVTRIHMISTWDEQYKYYHTSLIATCISGCNVLSQQPNGLTVPKHQCNKVPPLEQISNSEC